MIEKNFLKFLALRASAILLFVTPITASAYVFHTPLDLGSSGSDVSALQQLLKDKLFYVQPQISGYFDSATQEAVKAFQKSQGIVSVGTNQTTGYGRVGPKTLVALNTGQIAPSASISPSQTVFERDLKLGMKGADVQVLQKLLNNSGFVLVKTGPGSPGHETFIFGYATQAALAKFQKSNGVTTGLGQFSHVAQIPTAPVAVQPSPTITPATTPTTAPVNPSLPAPSLVQAWASGQDAYVVWQPVPSATSYIVKRSKDGGDYVTIVSTNVTTYSDRDISKGSQYKYIVVSENSGGQSGASVPGGASATGGSGGGGAPAPTPIPDTTAPTVSLSAPADGDTISGSSTLLSSTASDNVGVAGVQFKLDGSNLGAEVTTAPYSFSWDLSGVSHGSHTLAAAARDSTGNTTSTSTISVIVTCTQATDFFTRLATQPSASQKLLYEGLVCGLVDDGVWSKLDALYTFDAPTSATALTNLAQSSYGSTVTGNLIFVANAGFSNDGSSGDNYINTGFNPSTANGHYAQNSASYFAWSIKNSVDPGDSFGTVTGSETFMTPRYPNGTAYFGINGGTFFNTAVSTTSALYGAVRSSSSQFTAYGNGAPLGTQNSTSTALANSIFTIGRGEGGSRFGGGMQSGAFGAALSGIETTSLYNRLNTFSTGMSADEQSIYLSYGDSITHGYGTTNGHNSYSQQYADTKPLLTFFNRGQDGSQVAGLVAAATLADNNINVIAKNHVLSVLIGVNDYVAGASTSTFLSSLSAYTDARRAAGWKVIVGTLLPASDVGFNGTWRNTVNAAIRTWVGVHADGIADFAADPVIGPDSAYLDPTLFFDTAEHPTDLGQSYMKAVITPVLDSFLQ